MSRWVVWAISGERKRALFYVEAECRSDAAELVEGMNLAADLRSGERARVNNQPTTETGNLVKRPEPGAAQ